MSGVTPNGSFSIKFGSTQLSISFVWNPNPAGDNTWTCSPHFWQMSTSGKWHKNGVFNTLQVCDINNTEICTLESIDMKIFGDSPFDNLTQSQSGPLSVPNDNTGGGTWNFLLYGTNPFSTPSSGPTSSNDGTDDGTDDGTEVAADDAESGNDDLPAG
jgi:hypothetical protein